MNTRHIVGSVVLVLIVWPFSVISADKTTMKFELLDSDSDGFISRSEATQNNRLRERWNSVDKNKDGKLTEKEFSAFATAPKEAFSEQ